MTAKPLAKLTPRIIMVCLLITGVIHLLPITGVIGGEHLVSLYDVSADTPNLSILLRHRAILFGILGGFLCVAAFRPVFQPLAVIGGLISVASFLVLALLEPDYSAALQKVVIADLVALACLLIAGGLLAAAASREDSTEES